jgi:hypothetical protein
MKTTKADKWFSIFIRLRDSDDNGYSVCITCGKIMFFRNLDVGHYVKREHQGVRFYEKNCHAQCKECNWLKQGNDAVYKEKIIELYGQETHDLLKSAERKNFKRTSLELNLLSDEYEKKAKELAKQKGLII